MLKCFKSVFGVRKSDKGRKLLTKWDSHLANPGEAAFCNLSGLQMQEKNKH